MVRIALFALLVLACTPGCTGGDQAVNRVREVARAAPDTRAPGREIARPVSIVAIRNGAEKPLDAESGDATTSGGAAADHGAQLFFPNEGTVNAFVVFVQHRDDSYDNELTSDPATEWPASWSRGRGAPLPRWAGPEGEALLAPPGTPPSRFPEGSISAFYHLMSGGRFTLTGDVYPAVYRPEHDRGWYPDNPGPFENGAVRLSHEILTSDEIQDYFQRHFPGERANVFDRFTNGTSRMTPDGLFDLVILVYRLGDLHNLIGIGSGYTSITSLGEFSSKSGDSFANADRPVSLGGLRVVDNIKSGSGVIVESYTKKAAVRIVAHEIGHRQFSYEHTCSGGNVTSRDADCIGIMGGPYLTMSAPDRLKLGWAEVERVDLSAIQPAAPYRLADALESGKVLRVQYGEGEGCGDVIVEARTWSNYWDRPPDGTNDDGDKGDFFLPQEGLYLYKASDGRPGCGGATYRYSSLESNGRSRDPGRGFRNGSTYQAGFGAGDQYIPARRPAYRFHRNPRLDENLAITGIERSDRGFRFVIMNGWREGTRAPGRR